MANVTTASMFTGSIFLPNTSTNYAEGQQLAQFIVQYERQYLLDYFGYTLGTAIINNIGSGTPDADLDKIIEGDTFIDDEGITQGWIGFSNTFLLSPIANYIYCKVQQQRDSLSTGVGEMFPIAENNIRTDAGAKVTNAWNEMCDMNYMLHKYMKANEDVTAYADYVGIVDSNAYLFNKTNRFSL